MVEQFEGARDASCLLAGNEEEGILPPVAEVALVVDDPAEVTIDFIVSDGSLDDELLRNAALALTPDPELPEV